MSSSTNKQQPAPTPSNPTTLTINTRYPTSASTPPSIPTTTTQSTASLLTTIHDLRAEVADLTRELNRVQENFTKAAEIIEKVENNEWITKKVSENLLKILHERDSEIGNLNRFIVRNMTAYHRDEEMNNTIIEGMRERITGYEQLIGSWFVIPVGEEACTRCRRGWGSGGYRNAGGDVMDEDGNEDVPDADGAWGS